MNLRNPDLPNGKHGGTFPGMASVTDALRKAIRDSGESRYAIAKATGIEESVLCRFMQGGGLRLPTVDRLCAHLGMELRSKSRKAVK